MVGRPKLEEREYEILETEAQVEIDIWRGPDYFNEEKSEVSSVSSCSWLSSVTSEESPQGSVSSPSSPVVQKEHETADEQ